MFKKHIIFQILYIIVGPLCPASLKHFIFYKAPPYNKSLPMVIKSNDRLISSYHI